jgi:quercetin dioxygenase-like cupin family protein
MAVGEGRGLRLLRILPNEAGYAAIMRVDPGHAIPPHRHSGAVHAYNLSGSRRIHTGDVIGPGAYVFEPPGNIDTWEAIGEEPCLILIVVEGDVEYLTPEGEVAERYNAARMRALHQKWCKAAGARAFDLSCTGAAEQLR